MEDYSSSTSFDLMIPSATLSIIIKFLSDILLYIDYRKIKSLVVKCPTGDDEIMKIRKDYTCPLELVHDMIKGKWKPIILWRLRLGATSLSKLQQDIEGITQKMLLEHLKELIEYGFVDKKTYSGYPLHVEYFLTESMGKEILEALTIIQHIGIEYLKNNGKEQELIAKNVVPY